MKILILIILVASGCASQGAPGLTSVSLGCHEDMILYCVKKGPIEDCYCISKSEWEWMYGR